MIYLTKPQRIALHRIFERHADCDHPTISYREFRKRVSSGWGCVMVQPIDGGMWLGIEPDGYTHS